MYIGIDLGSRSIKIVSLDDKLELVSTHIFNSIDFYKNYGKLENGCFKLDLTKLEITNADKITTTGYGKHNVQIENVKRISEQKAHVLGAITQVGLDDFILLDMGGQDTKIIEVQNKLIMDIQMNDKCGASSGRYLENMATILQIDLAQLSQYSENWIEISTTCAIFGESEVLGKIFEGYSRECLAASVNYSLYKRVAPSLIRYSAPTIIFTGGVALNGALLSILRQETCKEVIVPIEPQLNGAIGAAVYGSF